MKKLFVLLIALVLLTSVLPAMSEQAAEWELDSYGAEGTLAKYKGAGGDVIVPSEINGKPVRVIGGNVFNGNSTITSIVLPEGVTAISGSAFVGCGGLKSITLPQSLRVIGAGAFSWNESLEELVIPAGVGYIGNNALGSSIKRITFEGEIPIMSANAFEYFGTKYGNEAISVPNDRLNEYLEYFSHNDIIVESGKNAVTVSNAVNKSDFDFDKQTGTIEAYNGASAIVEIPAAIDGVPVRAIGKCAFERSADLYAVILPEGLETIGERAFALCRNELYISLPDTLKTIEKEAFESVRFLLMPQLPSSLEIIGERAFLNMTYNGGDEFVFPEGLIQIGDEAFSGATLTDPVLPSTLKYIGNRAFSNAYFTYMAINSKDLPQMGEEPFYGKPLKNLADIDLPWDTTREQWESAKAVFDDMGFANLTVWRNNPSSGGHCHAVSFNDAATKGAYDTDGFLSEYTGKEANLSVYTEINWNSGSVKTIGVGEGVFRGNKTIRSFYPHHCDWFTTISDEAFADSTLEYIEMYDSITTVGARAFKNCTGLTEIVLPVSLTSISADAYMGCTGILSADIKCDAANLPVGLFDDCANLTEIAFSNGAIPKELLSGKSGIQRITLSEGVKEIGAGAFRDCTGITEIEIPETVEKIAPDAFAGCTGLTKVVVRCDASVLSASMFADCAGLAYVSFDKGSIPAGVLENRASVTTVALGKDVTGIGARAFANTSLSGFVIPSDIPIDYSAFIGIKNLYMDENATDAQLAECTAAAEYPWYDAVVRTGEESKLIKMPFEPTSADSFEFEPETGTIYKYLGSDVDVVIPREINGVTVRELAYNTFDRCSDYTNTEIANDRTEWLPLRSVVLPETIEVVSDSLFYYCQQLETFICYAPLETTGKGMFTFATSLENVVFVNGVRQIDNYCFERAGKLTNLWFGDKLERIGVNAFWSTKASKLVLNASTIESGAVTLCDELTELHFGDRVTKFADVPVQDCPKLDFVCLEMANTADIIPGGMMLARLTDTVTVRLPADATDKDVRKAEFASLMGTTMKINVVREICPTAAEEAVMPDPTALMNGKAALAEYIPASKPVERVYPEPKPMPEAKPVFKPIGAKKAPAHELAPELINIQGTTSTMNTNGAMLYTAWTNADARYVAMFDENGTKLHTWDAAAYAISENDALTWYLPHTFAAEGKFTTYFSASADDIAYNDSKLKITVTINPANDEMTDVPAVIYISANPTPAFRFANTNFSVKTDNNARCLSAYDEDGNLIRTWTLEDGSITSYNSDLFWNVFIVFERDGQREIVFRASADGVNYGKEKKAYITVRYAPKPSAEEEEPIDEPIAEPVVEPTVEPAVEPIDEPIAEPTVEPTVEPTAEPTEEPKLPNIERVDVRYVCTEVEYEGGLRLPASMLGLEYSLQFNSDGTLNFDMQGMELPDLSWTRRTVETASGETEAFIIDYYGAGELVTVLTETGFEMNFFDTMLLYFEPEAN